MATQPFCPECKGTRLVQDMAEVACSDCGYVVEPVISLGPERRSFTPEDGMEQARTGPPATLRLHDKGLSTVIGLGSRKSDSEEWLRLQSLKKWQNRARIGNEHNLALALSEIQRLASLLSLPRNVTETGSLIYRRAFRNHLVRGRTMLSLGAAALYLACRETQVCRSLDDVATAAGLNKTEVARNYRVIVRALDRNVPPATNQSYAAMFANRLKMSGQTGLLAMRLLQTAEKTRLTSGRGPQGLAAASTYVASVLSNERLTQRTVAEAAGVTEVTVRNRYKEILSTLRVEIRL